MAEDEPDPFPSGYHFSRYVIESELPSGQLGRVYKAFDTALQEIVAINVLAPELRHSDGKRRLLAGLQRARQKPDPQGHEYGEWKGIPFVVVAYIEGTGAAIDVAQQ